MVQFVGCVGSRILEIGRDGPVADEVVGIAGDRGRDHGVRHLAAGIVGEGIGVADHGTAKFACS